MHSALIDEATRNAWRRRGQKASMKSQYPDPIPIDLSSDESARALIENTISLARAGKLPTSTATAISKLVSTGLKLGELRLARKLEELEQRVSASTPSTVTRKKR
jgi:hypothetical protein